jgi:hypothetical protein
MYELAAEIGVDRIAINPVMDIPRERIDQELLLTAADVELVRPFFEQLYALDRDRKLLHVFFPTADYNAMLAVARQKSGYLPADAFPTASSFREENGHCFFAWYTMTIRGNGDLYPCCLLMNPEYEPLGNASEGKIADHWNGAQFNRMRGEMREVMLRKGEVFFQPQRFQTIRKQCVEPGACWLKNMYFRGDETFYRELAEAMETARKREVRLLGTPQQMARAVEAAAHRSRFLHAAWDVVRLKSRPLRMWLKRRFRLNVAGVAVRSDAPR